MLFPAPHTPRVILPEHWFAGYIFDLDGTLVDSMPLHFRAWRQALQDAGVDNSVFDWNDFLAHGGMAAVDIVKDLNRKHNLSMPPEKIAHAKRSLYADFINREKLPVISETVGLVHELRHRGIPYAIGTGSAIAGARQTLQAADLQHLFPIIVTPEDVEHGKPAPDIFLRAAELMCVPARDCVVFEDADPGVQAAAAAGMHSVRVLPLPSC